MHPEHLLWQITGKEPYLKAVVAPVPPPPAKPENDVELIALEQNLKSATNEVLPVVLSQHHGQSTR